MVVEGDELVSVSGRHGVKHLLPPKSGTDKTISSELIVGCFLTRYSAILNELPKPSPS
jgi:hypothetical protein